MFENCYDSTRQPNSLSSEACAEPCREDEAHLPLVGTGGLSGVSAPTDTPHPSLDEDFFAERGITRAVAEKRPYLRYERGDPQRLLREHWPKSKQHAGRIGRQSAGIIIPRYAPPSLRLAHVPAELRPDTAVITSSHHHYHGDGPTHNLVIPSTGTRLPRKWIHKPEGMTRHIEKIHGGINVQEVHLDSNLAKYVFPPGDGAKRLDVHPHAWPKFVNASRVFFVIEGCLKADAVLSAGEAVFSVPSVTLWQAKELPAFASCLRGKTAYIVPDNDLFNPEARGHSAVKTQALFCRTFLRRLGIDARIAAPPYPGHKGIDDYLGFGGTMDDLAVLDRDPPFGLAEWMATQAKFRRDRLVRAAEGLRGLALHADSNGEFKYSLRAASRIMGIHHSRLQRSVEDLQDLGAVEVEGDLSTAPRWRDPKTGKWVAWDWESEDRPIIRIHPALRANDKVTRLCHQR